MPNIKPNIFNNQAVSAKQFLSEYWQNKPYLFRQTEVPLTALPNRQQLFELAAQDGVQSRIIYSPDQRRYRAHYDDPDAWSSLTDQHPTLLVSDIEKWFPKAMSVLTAFNFIKAWRFDDLMLSYAPKGASVGAHIDQYDVFLVQVRGQRQWSYDHHPLTDFESVEDSDLAVIDGYQAQQSHTLSPGDILYLPPRIPHHGVSLDDDCLTLSVGLRAPSAAELITAVADELAQKLPESERLKDAGNEINATAAITAHEIDYLRQQLRRLEKLSDVELADVLGRFLTGYRLLDDVPELAISNDDQWLQKNPADHFAYYALNQQSAHLYINGDLYRSSLPFAELICNQHQVSSDQLKEFEADHHLLETLLDYSHLIAVTT